MDFLNSFLQRATANGSKTTVLMELRWYLGITCSAFVLSLKYTAPTWILILFAVMLGLGVFLYLWAYCYFATRSPEYLRSEKYALTKMAIEHSMTGDNLMGLIDPQNSPKPLPPSVTVKEEK